MASSHITRIPRFLSPGSLLFMSLYGICMGFHLSPDAGVLRSNTFTSLPLASKES